MFVDGALVSDLSGNEAEAALDAAAAHLVDVGWTLPDVKPALVASRESKFCALLLCPPETTAVVSYDLVATASRTHFGDVFLNGTTMIAAKERRR